MARLKKEMCGFQILEKGKTIVVSIILPGSVFDFLKQGKQKAENRVHAANVSTNFGKGASKSI